MSDSISYVNFPKAERRGRGRPCGSSRGLTRRELTPRIVARFDAKVNRGAPAECWSWTGAHLPKGYGQINLGRALDGKQHTEYAHRIAYVLAYGPIPGSTRLVVMHTCDHPPCCNPAHLRLGTDSDNLTDASRKGRLRRAA